MGVRVKKFPWVRPGTLHTFRVKAWNGSVESDWAEIQIKTTTLQYMSFGGGGTIDAVPKVWNRSIRINWTPIIHKPGRLSHYLIFRKNATDDGIPTNAEMEGGWTDKEEDPFFLANNSKLRIYFDKDIDPNKTYYYWVYGVDIQGDCSDDTNYTTKKYLGPDNSELGPPTQPILKPEHMETEVHEKIRSICDVRVIWKCVGGAEHYIIQRRMKGLPLGLWGMPIRVEHDPDVESDLFTEFGEHDLQETTIHNFFTNKYYEFRIRAVNIPVILVSAWSATDEYLTGYDNEAPTEVKNLAARRTYDFGFLRGEHIKLTWDRPEWAILGQEIDHYRIYRLKGTDAQATAEKAAIIAGTATPYSEENAFKFGGTSFIDDNIEPITGTGTDFDWDGDYNGGTTDQDRRTAETLSGTTIGTLSGSATIASDQAYDGTYALKIPALGGYLTFINASLFSSSEGYISLYWYPTTGVVGRNDIFRAYYDVNNYFEIYYFSGRVFVEHCGNGNLEVGGALVPPTAGILYNTWNHIEIRWDTATNTFECRGRDEASWRDQSPTNLTTFTNEPTNIDLGAVNNFDGLHYVDNLQNFLDQEGGGQEYYHYWVTAVDTYGQESTVTGPNDDPNESYDKVSFGPPDAPSGVTHEQNMILNILSVKLFSFRMSWDGVDEATHYQCKYQIRPVGTKIAGGAARDYGPEMLTPLIREETSDNSHSYPFPLVANSQIKAAVRSWNKAGFSGWSQLEEITLDKDTVAPGAVEELTGECFGVKGLLGVQYWWWVKLRWKDRPPYEGVKVYNIQVQISGVWTDVGTARPTIGPNSYVIFWDFALPAGPSSYTFRIWAEDWEDPPNEAIKVEVVVPWSEWWKPLPGKS